MPDEKKGTVSPVRLEPECVKCLVNKQIGRYPADTPPKIRTAYMQKLLRIIADAPVTMSAPEIMDDIYQIQKQMFGADKDYKDIKNHFNKMMLEIRPALQKKISGSPNPFKLAVQYAMTGNYIDFAAMNSVDEKKLKEMLDAAENHEIDTAELEALYTDITQAKKMVYLTDNCGEIVLDGLLIERIQRRNPKLDICVIVRGCPVVNDAVMEDARQAGLTSYVTVIGNGSSAAGTCLERISDEAREKIDASDVIIAKGQGNFETLQMCGKNIYYIFMCKCKLFAERFQAPMYQGILVNDRHLGNQADKVE